MGSDQRGKENKSRFATRWEPPARQIQRQGWRGREGDTTRKRTNPLLWTLSRGGRCDFVLVSSHTKGVASLSSHPTGGQSGLWFWPNCIRWTLEVGGSPGGRRDDHRYKYWSLGCLHRHVCFHYNHDRDRVASLVFNVAIWGWSDPYTNTSQYTTSRPICLCRPIEGLGEEMDRYLI